MSRTLLVALAACTACSHKNIRGLEAVELKYYQALDERLKSSKDGLAQLLASTRINEERALRELALQDARVQAASMVYSVREMLTAPKGDRAAFVQGTRNKVVLLTLDRLAALEEENVHAQLAAGDEQRRQLDGLKDALVSALHATIDTEKALHKYLNQDTPSALRDVAAEVQKQVEAFNDGIKDADPANPVVQKLVDEGRQAQKNVNSAKADLEKFIGVWSQLNHQKE